MQKGQIITVEGTEYLVLKVAPNGTITISEAPAEPRPPVEPKHLSARCPKCQKTAEGFDEVKQLFGYRTPQGKKTIKQSQCRACRSQKKKGAE